MSRKPGAKYRSNYANGSPRPRHHSGSKNKRAGRTSIIHSSNRRPVHALAVGFLLMGSVVTFFLLSSIGDPWPKLNPKQVAILGFSLLVFFIGLIAMTIVQMQRQKDLANGVAPFPKTIRFTVGSFLLGIAGLCFILAVVLPIGAKIDNEYGTSGPYSGVLELVIVGASLATFGLLLQYLNFRQSRS